MRKSGSYAYAPTLFYGKKPILYGGLVSNQRPKVTSTKWVCFSHSPDKAVGYYYPTAAQMGLNGTAYANYDAIVPIISDYKKTDCSSGLTVAVKKAYNSSANLPNSALSVTRSSISTTYINVFAWLWVRPMSVSELSGYFYPQEPYAYFSNSQDYNIPYGEIYPYHEFAFSTRYDAMSQRANIDGKYYRLIEWYMTIPKNESSSTYLNIIVPWCVHKHAESAEPAGWGIVLEPTNTNSYPHS